ncbi:hypothetical protein [Beduinella massiliensis]|uniref:hypothetical protein n=1 Tax=Beduinella massiliensis TaxID=1852363 RepID=UPI0011AF5C65
MNLYIPFNSANGDRRYSADDFAALFSSLLGDGVLLSSLDALQVIASGDWGIAIKPGRCIIRGRIGVNTTQANLTLAPAATGNPRIDRVVLRCDYINRKITEMVIQGTPAISPVAPTLRNDSEAVDLPLARITIKPTDASVAQQMIVDERKFSQSAAPLDTDALFAQWDDAFETWFESVRGTLSGDAAGNLAQKIMGCIYEVSRETINVPAAGWTVNAQGAYEKTVSLTGTVANSATQRVRFAVQGEQIGKVLLSGCRVDTDGQLTIICLSAPTSDFALATIIEDVRQ